MQTKKKMLYAWIAVRPDGTYDTEAFGKGTGTPMGNIKEFVRRISVLQDFEEDPIKIGKITEVWCTKKKSLFKAENDYSKDHIIYVPVSYTIGAPAMMLTASIVGVGIVMNNPERFVR